MSRITLSGRKLAIVLAGLRAYQKIHAQRDGDVPDDLLDIATDGGDFKPLDLEEIDDLCERLNK